MGLESLLCMHVISYKILVTLHLHFSIRILPHKQNSGGFFVAVLEKKYSLRDVQKSGTTVCEPASDCSMVATSQPMVTQNNTSVLDTGTCSPSESKELNSAISIDTGVSEEPVTDSSIHPGWYLNLF